jgi:hypothetical protein
MKIHSLLNGSAGLAALLTANFVRIASLEAAS